MSNTKNENIWGQRQGKSVLLNVERSAERTSNFILKSGLPNRLISPSHKNPWTETLLAHRHSRKQLLYGYRFRDHPYLVTATDTEMPTCTSNRSYTASIFVKLGVLLSNNAT
ncbi:MAG: hypothetical protein CL912_25745 [Deltaproteobacteria bacterium]|nr:hypothetical protein [Deltaproteobacteria bacterium]MAD86376.1 hypothetical protein [Deltaproteobacteria bacterium]